MSPCNRYPWMILAGILLLGALLRGLYLSEIAAAPDFTQPNFDACFHDYWARALLSGDWTPPAGTPDPHISERPYLRPPGYPYFLALIYKLCGGSFLGARIGQLMLGLLNVTLAFLLGRAVFNRRVGLIFAGLCAVFWEPIYFEGELQAPVLIVTLSLSLLLILARWLAKPSLALAFVAGVVLGLLALVLPNSLLFAPAAAAWILWTARGSAPAHRAVISAAAFLLGALLAVAPAALRNALVADDFVFISANGGVNLYIGNNPESDGVSTDIPEIESLTGQSGWSVFNYDRLVAGLSEREGRPLKYSEVSRHFSGRALAYIKDHPGRFLALTARRAALFWGPAAVANNKAISVERSHSRILRFLPGFPFVLSLSILGAILYLLDRRKTAVLPEMNPLSGPLCALVALYVLAIFLSYLPFLVAERFRAPLIPAVFVFGAYGIARIAQRLAARDRVGSAKLLAAAVALFVLCRTPIAEYEVDPAWWHTDRALAYVARGENAAAFEEFDLALKQNPDNADALKLKAGLLANLGRNQEAIGCYEAARRIEPKSVDLRVKLAGLRIFEGRAAEAAKELKAVLAEHPGNAAAHFALGTALIQLRDFDGAETSLRESLRLDPRQPAVLVNLGIVLAERGDLPGAAGMHRRAIVLDPRNADAHRWLGLTLCAADSVEAGIAACETALRLDPGKPTAALNLGNFFFRRGEWGRAAEWFGRAVGIDPEQADARAMLGASLANLGRYAEALPEFEAAARLRPQDPKIREQMERLRGLLQQH